MGEFVMHRLFPIVCNMSLTASVVILAVLAVRLLLRRAPKVFSYALWAVVLFRLLCPVSVTSAVSLLGALGAPGLTRLLGGEGVKWFSGGTSAMIMLMIASIWQNFGINMLFFMTGLQAIPPEMYEAASIDGASNTRQFLTITIPLLGPVLQMVLMNAILGSLKVTDLVLTLTNGKPSGKTEVMMTYIYKKFFGDGGASGLDFGYGAALTVVTAVILGIVTLIYLRATKKSSDVY